MSRAERKSAWPPSWKAPTSKETRVRVELLAKIIPSVFPASGFSAYSPRFIRSANSNRATSSGQVKSGIAVKVHHPQFAAALGPERFHREIEILTRLRHARIVPVLESDEAGTLLYLV